jgi:hypothetical protein
MVSHTDRAVLHFGSMVGSELRALGLRVDLVCALPQPMQQQSAALEVSGPTAVTDLACARPRENDADEPCALSVTL